MSCIMYKTQHLNQIMMKSVILTTKKEIIEYLKEYEKNGWNGYYRIDNEKGCCFLGTLQEIIDEF